MEYRSGFLTGLFSLALILLLHSVAVADVLEVNGVSAGDPMSEVVAKFGFPDSKETEKLLQVAPGGPVWFIEVFCFEGEITQEYGCFPGVARQNTRYFRLIFLPDCKVVQIDWRQKINNKYIPTEEIKDSFEEKYGPPSKKKERLYIWRKNGIRLDARIEQDKFAGESFGLGTKLTLLMVNETALVSGPK